MHASGKASRLVLWHATQQHNLDLRFTSCGRKTSLDLCLEGLGVHDWSERRASAEQTLLLVVHSNPSEADGPPFPPYWYHHSVPCFKPPADRTAMFRCVVLVSSGSTRGGRISRLVFHLSRCTPGGRTHRTLEISRTFRRRGLGDVELPPGVGAVRVLSAGSLSSQTCAAQPGLRKKEGIHDATLGSGIYPATRHTEPRSHFS